MKLGRIVPIGAALLSAAGIQAQVVFDGNYLQDFDSLGATGTTLPDGWSAVRYAGSGVVGASLSPVVTTGTATGGGLYNVGAAGGTDRALGSLSSSSTMPRFGLQLQNQSGMTLDSLTLEGVMEQWRSGSSATAMETLLFEYSLNAAGINDPAASWFGLSALNLSEKLTFSTGGAAVDGNAPEQQWLLSGGINDLGWAQGGVLTLRWTDVDDVGSDGMYALDSFRVAGGISPVPEPGSVANLMLGLAALGGGAWWQRRRA